MIKKSSKDTKNSFFKSYFSYIFVAIFLIAAAFIGSIDKANYSSNSLNMEALASNNFNNVSTDQLSEFYMVATLANSMKLASSETVASNYVTVSVMKNAGQNATDKIERPTITDTSSLARCGVNRYVVADGESIDSIAAKYGISSDQVRWSNNLKTANLSLGQTLLVPGTPGIVYTVKSGDSVESLAGRYGSSVDEIVACNDLETNRNLAIGTNIVIPRGLLPETERPEYVAPRRQTITYSYSYSGSSNSRENLRVIATGFYVNSPGNPGVPGQCTWYAWYMRATDPRSLGQLPGGTLGNASSWAGTMSRLGYRVDKTPEVGAVFQTSGGSYYGHVGYVTAVNPDGSITVREMNYGYATYRVTEAEIPASSVGNFNYIH